MIPNVDHVIVVAMLIFGIYAFLVITGDQMRWPSRRSNKAAESIYGNYIDSDRKQHRDPRQHGETWTDAGPARLAIRNISSGDSAQAIPHVARCGELSIPAGKETGSLRLRPRYESGAGGMA